MYQDMLLPTDGSDSVSSAVKRGIELARDYDATVHALTVKESTGAVKRDQIRHDPDEAAEQALTAVQKEAEAHSVPTEIYVESGVPHAVITDYVDTHDIDLIVMGTHGRTGLQRMLVGSVAERVIRKSDVPILVVSPDNISE